MEAEIYKGYNIWGHAIPEHQDIFQPERYAASGTITRINKLVEASGVIGIFDSEDDARRAGLDWSRAWVDSHG